MGVVVVFLYFDFLLLAFYPRSVRPVRCCPALSSNGRQPTRAVCPSGDVQVGVRVGPAAALAKPASAVGAPSNVAAAAFAEPPRCAPLPVRARGGAGAVPTAPGGDA